MSLGVAHGLQGLKEVLHVGEVVSPVKTADYTDIQPQVARKRSEFQFYTTASLVLAGAFTALIGTFYLRPQFLVSGLKSLPVAAHWDLAGEDRPSTDPAAGKGSLRGDLDLSSTVRNGNRAVTINIDSRTGVEGFARVGSIVDVVLTYVDRGGDLQSTIISEAAQVLSYGGITNTRDSEAKTGASTLGTLTLEVSSTDALRINTGAGLVPLSLLLREPSDTAKVGNLSVTAASILGVDQNKADTDPFYRKYCPTGKFSRAKVGVPLFPANYSIPKKMALFSQCHHWSSIPPL
ncbi:MAG: Flp pilus assembly protein CpaB [Proteobacteria bacterium]|nr:MAG: Flp pilus assembly protein CpaB [Pseudomonadota bacterium]